MITVRFCYEDTPEFWRRWKEELADIVTEISLARPDCGGYIANCPFHGAIGHHYTNMEVVSTQYLHSIYTVSTQYLHSIYTPEVYGARVVSVCLLNHFINLLLSRIQA